MSFAGVVLKNLWRNKIRTALTLLGISIGIATILMLGAVADGLEQSMGSILTAGGADFTVTQANSADLTFSSIPESLLTELAGRPDIAEVDGVLLAATQFRRNPMFMLFGASDRSPAVAEVTFYDGRPFTAPDELNLGKVAAATHGVAMGDTVEIMGRSLRVVGLFESGDSMKDGAALLPLDTLQELLAREGTVTLALVRVAEGADVVNVARAIDRDYEGRLVTITSVDEVSRADQGIVIIRAASWLISALAIIIGGIGVMNTMIISVYDRVREIGVLKALGWRRRTVIRLILSEAAVIGLGSVVIGTILAVPVLEVISRSPLVEAFLRPAYSPGLWLQAAGVALLVALIGGLYPAYRAAGLSPVEALRHE